MSSRAQPREDKGAAVSRELARKADLRGKTVLDIGCGIGGAARMLREEFDCCVTGLDLSQQYIETARQLTRLVGITDNIRFLQGNALDLPLQDQSFDVVWTQHVQMNIRDKDRFYQEIARILRAEGHLLFYEIWKKGPNPISFPVPWAGDASINFLVEKEDIHQLLLRLGFTRISSSDETEKGIHFFEQLLEKLHREGPPPIGLNLLMGSDSLHKIAHLLDGLKRGALELESACYRKVGG